jgi:hypothetical protein
VAAEKHPNDIEEEHHGVELLFRKILNVILKEGNFGN